MEKQMKVYMAVKHEVRYEEFRKTIAVYEVGKIMGRDSNYCWHEVRMLLS